MVRNEDSDQRFLEELKGIIEENIDDTNFSIEQLSRETGLSRSQLFRKVKAASSLSLSLFIRKVRLQKAQSLLESTDLTIAEVAYHTGISSPQNFTKYFTAEFGLNPSEYRKQKKSNLNASVSEEETSILKDESPPLNETFQKSHSPQPQVQESYWRKIGVTAIALVSVIFILIFLSNSEFLHSENAGNSISKEYIPSIAVLPFNNLNKPEDQFLSDGVVEDILTHLTKFKNLKVISRTSTMQYRNTEKSIRQIASELEVDYVLEGSIRQSDNQIRITAQLINAGKDQHLWAKNFDRNKENLMEIQSDVALEIAEALNQEISPDLKRNIKQLPTSNVDAYHALLRGRHLLRTREKDALEASIQEFEEAIKLDPHFSEAYTGKAAAYFLLRDAYFDAETARFLQMAERYALRAIKEDGNNAQAFAYLGHVYMAQYNWEEAFTVFEIALNLNPSDALINYWYGIAFRSTGRLEEALKYQEIATSLDPLYPVIHAGYSYTCILAGKYTIAEKLLEQGEILFKNSFLHETTRGNLYLWQEDYEKAIEYLDLSLAHNPNFEMTKIGKVYCQGKLGQKEAVEAYLATLDTHQPNDCLRSAEAYLSLGEDDKCIELLRRAADFGRIDNDILVDRRYKHLLSHPTMVQILQEFGLYQYLPVQQ